MATYDFTPPPIGGPLHTFEIRGEIFGISDGATPDDAVRNLLWEAASETPPSGVWCVVEISGIGPLPLPVARVVDDDSPTELVIRWLKANDDSLWSARRAVKKGDLRDFLDHASQCNPFHLSAAIVDWFWRHVDLRDVAAGIMNP